MGQLTVLLPLSEPYWVPSPCRNESGFVLLVPAVPGRGQFSLFSTEINVFVLVSLASADIVSLHVVSP